MRTEPDGPIQAIILGTDTVLAARPAEPIQVVRACLRLGFEFVAPVSWGEELLAMRVAEVLEARHPASVLAAHCPLVVESLRAAPTTATPCIASVAPPVATARYLRAAFRPRTVHVTYVGACPGASGPDIDQWILPEALLAQLVEHGIDVGRLPCHLDGQLPADRARYASVPGGMPAPAWLARRTGVIEREATPVTLRAVTGLPDDDGVLVDLEVACGCTCARDRVAAARIDPPRSSTPVVVALPVELADRTLFPAHRLLDVGPPPSDAPALLPGRAPAERGKEMRAAFLERGLSGVDALRPPEPLTSQRLTPSLDPWTAVMLGPASHVDGVAGDRGPPVGPPHPDAPAPAPAPLVP